MACKLSVDAICRSIESLLPGGCPVIKEVAQLLSVSSGSLQHLLDDEAVSYAELLDGCRCQIACDALEHTRDTVQEIAAFLGYRDVDRFTRAFRRWTGKAPRAYREDKWSQSTFLPCTDTNICYAPASQLPVARLHRGQIPSALSSVGKTPAGSLRNVPVNVLDTHPKRIN